MGSIDRMEGLTYVLGTVVVAVSAAWYQQVETVVKEPYLVGIVIPGDFHFLFFSFVSFFDQKAYGFFKDEVFHVHQAQAYCEGHWQTWDPKITTPPDCRPDPPELT